MNSEILVPLDGSTLAEAALPQAIMLASVTASSVTLVRACEPPRTLADAGAAVPHGLPTMELAQSATNAAASYLDGVAGQLREHGIEVRTRTALTDPSRLILDYAAESSNLALIVMATHGRSGLLRLLLGSVAERVAQHSGRPLLLVRPTSSGSFNAPLLPASPYRRILVPLDGSPLAEGALEQATKLATACGATVELLVVLPALDESIVAEEAQSVAWHEAMQPQAVDQAKRYLQRLAERLGAGGLTVRTAVAYGDPAACILAVAARDHADLIAMATHGRSGLQRLWLGSVALKVVRGAVTPVLLLRPR